jgi:BlaI family transcriptional regulator, penicillinase repressor
MDTRIPPPLHELEEEVMDEVWRRDEVSVGEVKEALNARAPKRRAYTTYMTVMARLDNKGLLERTRRGKTDFYRALYSRQRYAELRARAAVDSLVDQFGDVALAHIARQMARSDPEHWTAPGLDDTCCLLYLVFVSASLAP